MLAELRRMVEELDIAIDGTAIAEALAVQSLLDARVAEAAAAFDKAELWDLDGSTSMVFVAPHQLRPAGRAANRIASAASGWPSFRWSPRSGAGLHGR